MAKTHETVLSELHQENKCKKIEFEDLREKFAAVARAKFVPSSEMNTRWQPVAEKYQDSLVAKDIRSANGLLVEAIMLANAAIDKLDGPTALAHPAAPAA